MRQTLTALKNLLITRRIVRGVAALHLSNACWRPHVLARCCCALPGPRMMGAADCALVCRDYAWALYDVAAALLAPGRTQVKGAVLDGWKRDGSQIDPAAAVSAGLLRCRPQDPVAHYGSAVLLYYLHDYAAAAASFHTAIKLAEEQNDFYFGAAAAW